MLHISRHIWDYNPLSIGLSPNEGILPFANTHYEEWLLTWENSQHTLLRLVWGYWRKETLSGQY
jgi:hypothetical protein